MALTSCARWPESYPPPEQRKPVLQRHIIMVAMNDPDVDQYTIKDFAPAVPGIYWRWTYDRPELRIWLKQAVNLRVAMDFGIVPETFKTTGPVTVTLFVNGKAVVSKRYKAAGDYHLEAPVPAGWITAPGFATVAAEARPIWIAPRDGQHLGIVIVRAGFL